MDSETEKLKQSLFALPRLARVTFSVRCARRILPLYSYHCPPEYEPYTKDLESAIALADEVASTPFNPNLSSTRYPRLYSEIRSTRSNCSRLFQHLNRHARTKFDYPAATVFTISFTTSSAASAAAANLYCTAQTKLAPQFAKTSEKAAYMSYLSALAIAPKQKHLIREESTRDLLRLQTFASDSTDYTAFPEALLGPLWTADTPSWF